MADQRIGRPKDDKAVDLGDAQELTAGLITRLRCPDDKTQAFLRDRKAPALRVRVTSSGVKAFVFEAKLEGQTIRRTIGDVRSWTIEAARVEANRLRVLTVGEAWAAYIEARRPRWGDLHYRDHLAKAKAGGEKATRGTRGRGKTVDGPLYSLMELTLRQLTPATISAWAAKETLTRPTTTRLSWRLLRGFLSWCSEQPEYADLLPANNPAKAKAVREVLGKPRVKQDVLQKGQLTDWFAAVRQLSSPMASAYLQTLLLTGARPGEILAMRWQDVNTKWKGLTIRDKVEGERIIPLTPYVDQLLSNLPRVNEWVFASPSREKGREDKAMSTPHKQHDTACAVAAVEGLTLHGLRRSFKSLTEWIEIPTGIVAQIMGHKPSATAEKHYTVRPLDLLRLHHDKIEAWILEQAKVPFVPQAGPAKLRAVK
jgi:integrase